MTCRNESCDRPVTGTGCYCSRTCQVQARAPGGMMTLRVTVPMSTWHRLFTIATRERMTVAEWVEMLADEEAHRG